MLRIRFKIALDIESFKEIAHLVDINAELRDQSKSFSFFCLGAVTLEMKGVRILGKRNLNT